MKCLFVLLMLLVAMPTLAEDCSWDIQGPWVAAVGSTTVDCDWTSVYINGEETKLWPCGIMMKDEEPFLWNGYDMAGDTMAVACYEDTVVSVWKNDTDPWAISTADRYAVRMTFLATWEAFMIRGNTGADTTLYSLLFNSRQLE